MPLGRNDWYINPQDSRMFKPNAFPVELAEDEELVGRHIVKKPNALDSLHGGKKREQEVHTPDWILDAVRKAFGGSIALDPCAATDPAAFYQERNLNPLFGTDGLCEEWPDRTFFNPPFKDLRAWLEWNARQEYGRRIGLFPFRPHRKWFLPLLAGNGEAPAEVIFLDYKVIFKGFKHTFPAPLVLVAWGDCAIPDLGPRETGRWRL